MPTAIVVGEPYPGLTPPLPESLQLFLDAVPFTLIASLVRPTREEVRAYREAPVQIGFTVEEGILFTVVRLKGRSWMDTPYHYSMEGLNAPPSLPDLPEDPGLAYGLSIVLVDALDARVKAIRLIGLCRKASLFLKEAVEAQRPLLDLRARVARVYARLSSEDLARRAVLCPPTRGREPLEA